MKANILLTAAIAAAASLSVYAQPQKGQPYMGKSPREVKQVIRPDGVFYFGGLSDEQRTEIKKIRTERMKERTQTRNLLKEKQAKLEVLQTEDKPNMKEIDKTIDEIASVKAKDMKAEAAARQKVRAMLTEEQRVYFDAFHANKDQMKAHRKNYQYGREGDRRTPRDSADSPRRPSNKN